MMIHSPLTLTFVMLAQIWSTATPATIHRCSCWEGYQPEIVNNAAQCQGIQVDHTMACNVLPPPKCSCTGHNGILKDRVGTWCTIYLKGVEVRRWQCENHDDWKDFFRRLQQQQKEQQDGKTRKRPRPRTS